MTNVHPNLEQIIAASNSFSEVAVAIGLCKNGAGVRKAKKACEGFSTSHFGKPRYMYQRFTSECPICGAEYSNSACPSRHKSTCSYACSNKFFRKGPEIRPPKSYRAICFLFNEKKCILCEECLIVEVHHADGNKTNNNPDNLVPLCPTHHQYWHSRHKHLIEQRVLEFIRVRAIR